MGVHVDEAGEARGHREINPRSSSGRGRTDSSDDAFSIERDDLVRQQLPSANVQQLAAMDGPSRSGRTRNRGDQRKNKSKKQFAHEQGFLCEVNEPQKDTAPAIG